MVPYLYLFSVDFVTELLSDFIEMNLYMQKFIIIIIIIIILVLGGKVTGGSVCLFKSITNK